MSRRLSFIPVLIVVLIGFSFPFNVRAEDSDSTKPNLNCSRGYSGYIRTLLAKSLRRAEDGIRSYAQDVKATGGRRILIKSREVRGISSGTEDSSRLRDFFKHPQEWLFNPIATALNRPTQVTIPVSMAGYYLLFDYPVSKATEVLEAKNNAHIQMIIKEGRELKDNTPGGDYIFGLAKEPSGGLDPLSGPGAKAAKATSSAVTEEEAARAIISQNRFFDQWVSNPKLLLPRIKDLVELKQLTTTEALELNEIAREVFLNFYKDRKITTGVSDELSNELKAKISESKFIPLNHADDQESEREIFGTIYWPSIKIHGHSDLDLAMKILAAQKESPSSPMRIIYDLVDGGLRWGDAYQMTIKIMKDPESIIRKKQNEVHDFIPADHQATLLRPDLPIANETLVFSTGGKSISFNSELDRWKVLLSDPRFADIAKFWKEFKINDLEAMNAFHQRVLSINRLAKDL